MSQQGWKLVPVEPTDEMRGMAMSAWMTRRPFGEVYAALLAAAPLPTQPLVETLDPRTRLHNLCDALSEQMDGSAFAREEWERIDKENAALLSIAKRWAALDGNSWNAERHARDKRELEADTLAAIRNATGDAA